MERLAKVERLSRYTDISMIDKLVTGSGGAYTHDDVFMLDAQFAYSLMLSRYERQCYLERADSVKYELKQNT